MKLGVCGSRSITDGDWVFYHLDQFATDEHVVILSGGAKGVDTLAEEYADANKIPHVLFKPYHMVDSKTKYEKKYFFARNKQIIDNSDEVLVLWDGTSGGTGWCIRYCEERKKKYTVIKYDPSWSK